MKPLWMQTLAWIAAVLVAVLLAWANPDGIGIHLDSSFLPHGSETPR
jgi:hypothetical protein